MTAWRAALLAAAAAAAAAGVAGCRARAPAPGADIAPLSRAGLDTLVGRRWTGGSVPLVGATEVQGWLVGGGAAADPVFAVAVFALGERRLIVLDQEVGRAGPHAVWEVRDAAWLPPLAAGHVLASSCRVGERSDEQLFAIVRGADTEQLTAVVAAWRASRATGRFERVPGAGLVCENEGWAV